MSNKIEKFLNENFGEVRCVKINDEVWFVAKDICVALEYSESNVSSVINRLDDDEKTTLTLTTSGNYTTNVLCINEDGVYDVVTGAVRKPKAKPFRKWITKEVLPTIRKTGGFVEDDREEEFVNKYFPSFSEEVKLAMVEDLLKTNKELKPKAEKFEQFLETDGTYTFTSVSKIISTKASEDGLDFTISGIKLTKFLRDNNILSKNKSGKSYTNEPRKGYEEYFNVTPVTHNQYGQELSKPKSQTRVKPCGIDFIYELVKNNIA